MSVCRRAYAKPQPQVQHGRHTLCVCVHSDIYRQVQQLPAEQQLSLSGAAHHLLPLSSSLSTLSSNSDGD